MRWRGIRVRKYKEIAARRILRGLPPYIPITPKPGAVADAWKLLLEFVDSLDGSSPRPTSQPEKDAAAESSTDTPPRTRSQSTAASSKPEDGFSPRTAAIKILPPKGSARKVDHGTPSSRAAVRAARRSRRKTGTTASASRRPVRPRRPRRDSGMGYKQADKAGRAGAAGSMDGIDVSMSAI